MRVTIDDDCLQELRWLYDRRDLSEARRDLAAWLAKWSGKYSNLTGWVEENIESDMSDTQPCAFGAPLRGSGA
jgi:putative transposase